jgi:hypothetical protein
LCPRNCQRADKVLSSCRAAAGVAQLPSSARGWIRKAGNEGFIKLIEDSGRWLLIDATSARSTWGEVLGALAIAVHGQVLVADLRAPRHGHSAGGEGRRAIQPLWVTSESGAGSCRHQPQDERGEDQLHRQLHLSARHDDDVRP